MSEITPELLEEIARQINEPYDPSISGWCKRRKASRQKCYDEMNAGRLPYSKIGSHRRIYPEQDAIWERRTSVNMPKKNGSTA